MDRGKQPITSRIQKRFLALFVASAISGCATLNQPGEFSDEELKLSHYATMTSADAVRKLEENYKTTVTTDLPVYAPQHLSTVSKALHDAKNLLSKDGSRDEIVRKVAVGHAVLKNADRVAEKVKETLSNELELKNKLDTLETNNVYVSEYGGLVERLNKIIQSVEAGKTEVTENREKLIQDMQRLEQKARRYNAMHEPEEILKRVKYSGGETLAPLTYKEAVEVFNRAEEFIKQNPTYDTGIEQVGKEALFAAKRALYITQEVAALGQKFKLSPEQIVLDEEYRLHRITREISNKDFRDHPLEVQSELVAKVAEDQANELKNKDDLVIALRDTLIKVRDSSSQLTALSETTKNLKAEKSEWLAKDALYQAKITDLQEQLTESLAQLDQTQKKVLNTASSKSLLQQEIEQSKKQINDLNGQLTLANQKLLEAQTQITALKTTNDKSETDNTAVAAIEKKETKNTDVNIEASITEPSIVKTESIEQSQRIATNNETKATETNTNPEASVSAASLTDTPSAEVVAEETTEQQSVSKKVDIETKIAEENTSPATEKDEQVAIDTAPKKITKEETFKALESAKELIEILQGKDNQKETSDTLVDTDSGPTNKIPLTLDEDVFVDASE